MPLLRGDAVSASQRLLRIQSLRNLVSPRIKAAFAENRIRLVRVRRRSELRNIYHCCVNRAGSQWIRKILADPDVYRVTGLRAYAYGPRMPAGRDYRSYTERQFEVAFPAYRIVSPLFITYDNFAAIPKPDPWRAFSVVRDPRDLVVSWYFSSAISHNTRFNPGLQQTREHLATLDEEHGLTYSIRRLGEFGLFDTLRSWIGVDVPEVLLLRYEDLIGDDGERWFERLLDHCDVALPPGKRRELLARYSFQALSGRQPGQEDVSSKLRKGVAGDWRNYFTPAVQATFAEVTGDLVTYMGYA